MIALVTGGSGLLGRALVERLHAQGKTVVSLSRHQAWPPVPEVFYHRGDILQDDLGWNANDKRQIDAVYHVAGMVNLAPRDPKGVIWATNVQGTQNVVDFCLRHQVPHLYYVSTAYTSGRNPYEESKAKAEAIARSAVSEVTVFKPSILLSVGAQRLEHFPQFAFTLIRVHRRADLIRRKLEGTLRLPVLEPTFRMKGNPSGRLNLVLLEDVASAMASIKQPGTFWLTNPSPPTMQQVADWLGDVALLKITVSPSFSATPLEAAFQRLTRALQPYLSGDDDFSSWLRPGQSMITRETIADMVANMLQA